MELSTPAPESGKLGSVYMCPCTRLAWAADGSYPSIGAGPPVRALSPALFSKFVVSSTLSLKSRILNSHPPVEKGRHEKGRDRPPKKWHLRVTPRFRGSGGCPSVETRCQCKMAVHFFESGGLRGGRRFEMGVSCMMVGREV